MRDLGVELGLRFTIEDSWGGDLTTAAVAHLAATTPPDALLMASFMNDWTLDHIAGYEPRSRDGRGTAPTGPGLGVEVDAETRSARRCFSSRDSAPLGAPSGSSGRPTRARSPRARG